MEARNLPGGGRAQGRTTTSSAPPTVLVAIAPRVALRVGSGVAIALALAGLMARLAWYDGGAPPGVYALVDLDGERNLPAWFSTLLLAACAASLWTVAGLLRSAQQPSHRYWQGLAVVFLYLSVDESLSLHERAIEPLREALDLGGALYYGWILVAVPVLLVLLAALVPFLRKLPRPTLAWFLVAGACYVGGAVGMEMVGGLLGSQGDQGSTAWHLVITVEESLEMIGAVLFLTAVNRHRERYVETTGTSRTGPAGDPSTPGAAVDPVSG